MPEPNGTMKWIAGALLAALMTLLTGAVGAVYGKIVSNEEDIQKVQRQLNTITYQLNKLSDHFEYAEGYTPLRTEKSN